MEESKREMLIGGKPVLVTDKMMKQSELEFYPENPRVFTALHTLEDDNPSQQTIEEEMRKLDNVKTLKASIFANGGLLEPIIVRGNVVLEGNSRLAAYRILAKTDPFKWAYIRCTVLPDDISEEQILSLLGTIHIIGRTDWTAFEKAGYLFRTKNKSRRPIESIANELGMKVSEAKTYIKVYARMRSENDMVPKRWSHYLELLKNPAIAKAEEDNPDMEIIPKIIEKIKEDKINDAKDIREVGKIVKSQHEDALMVLEQYLDGEIDLEDALDLTGDLNRSQTISKGFGKFHDLLANNLKYISAQMKQDADLVLKIRQINNTLDSLIKKMA